MPYVQRDASSNIIGLFANPQAGYATEFLVDNDSAIVAFLAPKPITSVTPRQARLALAQAGLLTQVTNAIALADQTTQITWQFAEIIDRHSPMIAAIAAAMNPPLTSAQIDQLFATAATL